MFILELHLANTHQEVDTSFSDPPDSAPVEFIFGKFRRFIRYNEKSKRHLEPSRWRALLNSSVFYNSSVRYTLEWIVQWFVLSDGGGGTL